MSGLTPPRLSRNQTCCNEKSLSGKFNVQSVSKLIELVVPDAGDINDQFVIIESAAVEMDTRFTKLECECYIEGTHIR